METAENGCQHKWRQTCAVVAVDHLSPLRHLRLAVESGELLHHPAQHVCETKRCISTGHGVPDA
eukprot:2613873-Rhodomonas_salina.1